MKTSPPAPAPPVAPSARRKGLRFLLVVLPVVIALSGAMGLILQVLTTSGPIEEASADLTPETTPDEPGPRTPEGVTAPLAPPQKVEPTPTPDADGSAKPPRQAPREPAAPTAPTTPEPETDVEEEPETPTPWPPQARLPGPPRALVAIPAGVAGEIALAWLEPLDDGGVPITSYRLYRGPTVDALALRGDVGNVLSLTDRGLSPGATYFYAVSAVNVKGEGPMSAPSHAVAYPDSSSLPTPELPTALLAALGVALLGAAGLARRRA